MEEISRAQLLALANEWARGDIDRLEVQARAGEWWEEKEWPTYPENDPRSIAIEVLMNLDSLDAQFIEKKDIPEIIAFLNTPIGKELLGWQRWGNYWDSIDYAARDWGAME